MVCVGVRTSAMNGLRNSLILNLIGVFGEALGCGDGGGQEGLGEHDPDGPAMPRGPGPYLMSVQASQSFAGLKRFLNHLASTGNMSQCDQRDRAGVIAAVVGQLAGRIVADQQRTLPGGGGFGRADPRP